MTEAAATRNCCWLLPAPTATHALLLLLLLLLPCPAPPTTAALLLMGRPLSFFRARLSDPVQLHLPTIQYGCSLCYSRVLAATA